MKKEVLQKKLKNMKFMRARMFETLEKQKKSDIKAQNNENLPNLRNLGQQDNSLDQMKQ